MGDAAGVMGISGKIEPDSLLASEERYAYYRRCQRFLRNGKQCKAPAMKGEGVCHQHAMQAEARGRRERQRNEILGRDGAGLGSPAQIGRTVSALAAAMLSGRIEDKAARELIWEIQKAMPAVRIARRRW
ncbi:MAG TPA: hypothetical protein VKW06_10000 [Candidatus Angelobacter sp.]|nr:hypothetical protein [Candidatus Angelobacter sp.]